MINSNAFNYVNVLDKAADSSWLRENMIANNIANIDTPGYKRQDLEFQNVLRKKMYNAEYHNLDQAVNGINEKLDSINGYQYTDYAGYSYRLDGNNVDVDTENVELASEQLRYSALTGSISQEFSRFKTAIGS